MEEKKENKLDKNKIQKIKLVIAFVVILIIAAIVIFRVVKYQKEGEKNMPYNIAKIIVVSRVSEYENNNENEENKESSEEQSEADQLEGEQSAENQEQEEQLQPDTQSEEQPAEEPDNSFWKFDLIQTSDVYISIEKNEENIKKDEKIKSITIENIEVSEGPQKGSIKAYMPNSLDGEKYSYTNDYKVSDSLTYRGSTENNFQNLQISSNGGIIGISFANTDIGTYASGEDTEITYDGTLLTKLGLTDEDIKCKISFDLIIELDDGKKYSGKVNLELTCDGLVENGTSETEITDFSDVIFKRI